MLEKLYLINLSVFISGVVLFATAEYFFASRKYSDSKLTRWGENFWMTIINTLIIRVFFFITPISAALYMTQNNIWLFPLLGVNTVVAWIIIFLLLDLIIYFEHVLFHKIPILWKFHSVHHSDLDMDFTTALRFHYAESTVSVITKIWVIALFGPPVWAVVLFEVVLNFSAMFNHSNFMLPKWLDKYVSKVIVTPKFHEIHHSQKITDSMSNYWFFLSLWDYFFSTYENHNKKIPKLWLSGQINRIPFIKLLFADTKKHK